jgi:hypothetical protein
MRVALFDYRVTPTNPVGGLHRRLLEGHFADHDFTVFAAEFDNPARAGGSGGSGASGAHFCHRVFLYMGQLGSSGMKVRRILQSLDHRLHAALEPLVFRRVRHVVVLGAEHPNVAGKVTVIANPVDLPRFQPPLRDREGPVSAPRSGLG